MKILPCLVCGLLACAPLGAAIVINNNDFTQRNIHPRAGFQHPANHRLRDLDRQRDHRWLVCATDRNRNQHRGKQRSEHSSQSLQLRNGCTDRPRPRIHREYGRPRGRALRLGSAVREPQRPGNHARYAGLHRRAVVGKHQHRPYHHPLVSSLGPPPSPPSIPAPTIPDGLRSSAVISQVCTSAACSAQSSMAMPPPIARRSTFPRRI